MKPINNEMINKNKYNFILLKNNLVQTKSFVSFLNIIAVNLEINVNIFINGHQK